MTGPCPYENCHHSHPELPRHWEAAPVPEAPGQQPAPDPDPGTEIEPS